MEILKWGLIMKKYTIFLLCATHIVTTHASVGVYARAGLQRLRSGLQTMSAQLKSSISPLKGKRTFMTDSRYGAMKKLYLTGSIENKQDALIYKPPTPRKHSALYQIGKETINKLYQVDGLIILIGSLSDKLFAAFVEWRRFQFPSIMANIESAGIRALPIVGLLSFLIGVVLAYQMGLQLEAYGASIFIAYLSGMAIFREFSPLITAIIVAGRTSSSFTAQIGSMKINEEIDALNTMGLSPIELIVIPKVEVPHPAGS